MKTLTTKEPWASLIIEEYKKYEFRSQKTKYRGKILIHAGCSVEKDMIKRFSDYNININPGYIIGHATIVDCIMSMRNLIRNLEILPLLFMVEVIILKHMLGNLKMLLNMKIKYHVKVNLVYGIIVKKILKKSKCYGNISKHLFFSVMMWLKRGG